MYNNNSPKGKESRHSANEWLRSAVLALGVCTSMVAASGSVQAATFDFADIADNTLVVEANWQDVFPGGLTVDGITLNASGTNANNTPADAFFDKGNAGLGVCSSVSCATGVQGANTADDNVSNAQGGETLTLAFSTSVTFTDLLLRGANHGLANGTLFINGVLSTVVNGALTVPGLAALSATNVWDFKFDNVNNTGTEFYISSATVSAVPLPPALLLLGSALLGLGYISRRRA